MRSSLPANRNPVFNASLLAAASLLHIPHSTTYLRIDQPWPHTLSTAPFHPYFTRFTQYLAQVRKQHSTLLEQPARHGPHQHGCDDARYAAVTEQRKGVMMGESRPVFPRMLHARAVETCVMKVMRAAASSASAFVSVVFHGPEPELP